MALIRQKTISGTDDKAIVVGEYSTSSIDGSITRHMAFGSDWNLLRIGISCAMVVATSQSYDRAVGLMVGVSSGSRTAFRLIDDRTFIGTALGIANGVFGYVDRRFFAVRDPISGSFYVSDTVSWATYATGTMLSNNGGTNVGLIPNIGTEFVRKGILIYEFSSSGNTYIPKLYAFTSSSVYSTNCNRNITTDELLSALTSSVYPPSASGILMTGYTGNAMPYNRTTYPLDTAFIDWSGGTPLEIYDWYIYKVR